MMYKCTRSKHCELSGFFGGGGAINYSCPLCKYTAGMKKTALFKPDTVYEEREEVAIE